MRPRESNSAAAKLDHTGSGRRPAEPVWPPPPPHAETDTGSSAHPGACRTTGPSMAPLLPIHTCPITSIPPRRWQARWLGSPHLPRRAPARHQTRRGLSPMYRRPPTCSAMSRSRTCSFRRPTPRGVIDEANEVFARSLRYERSELLGAPHSIIRTPTCRGPSSKPPGTCSRPAIRFART